MMRVDGIPIKYELLPEQFRGGVERWIEHGIRPGSFLTAVMDDELFDALTRADDEVDVLAICLWFHNQAPPLSFGSPEQTAHWHEARMREAA